MIETIFLAAVAAAPAIVAITGIIAAVCKLMKSFNELKGEVVNVKEYTDLKKELKEAHKENRELKKQLNEVLTALTRVEHK